ncbi:CapA family protein [Actinophytocola sp.]|uniref:CapA family protein n=1 Tax=Actinophytocola sp. TaxID=1872138 RepID=UPI0025BB12A3|nr:CapA family protein [Actinophytocola sp.]
MTPLLQVEEISKRFVTGRAVLSRKKTVENAVTDVSFSIEQGETVALVGESGAGKSTVGRLVLGLLTPDGGVVRFDGADIARHDRARRREFRGRARMIFQDPFSSLDPSKSIGSSIEEPLLLHTSLSARERQHAVGSLLENVQIGAGQADRYPRELSGGQLQRIAIARAIATDPLLIVCDEAVSALDMSIQAQVINLLLDLQSIRSMAYIFVSHDLALARTIADRVIVMRHGRIVEEGGTDRLFTLPEHPYTRSLLAAIPGEGTSLTSGETEMVVRRLTDGVGKNVVGSLPRPVLHDERIPVSSPVVMMAVGDILIDRERPASIFEHVKATFDTADLRFANCEQMYSDELGHPNPTHATYSTTANISALEYAGFEVVSMANNHTLDWGTDTLLDTLRNLNSRGISTVGAGSNIVEARKPVIVSRNGVSIGFLAYGCVGPVEYAATDDRPGYAPVHSWTVYDKVDYQPATPQKIYSFPKQDELQAMCADITSLRAQVDVVVVSVHWGLHYVARVIPDYCRLIGHAAVDAGAHVVIGTHPHILKGIEVYRKVPIFYSTGNFALEIGPYGLSDGDIARLTAKFKDLYGYEPDPSYPTYPMHPEAKTTMIVKANLTQAGLASIGYIPCYVNPRAEPEVVRENDARGKEVFEYVADISRSEGLATDFRWENDEVVIDLRTQGS